MQTCRHARKGAIVLDTNSGSFKGNTGTPDVPNWVEFSSSPHVLPPGTVIMTARTSCPSGTILANGDSLVRSEHQDLFDAIGTTYGSADSTHFNIPNAQGVFIRGAGTQTISSISYSGTQGTSQRDEFQGHRHPQTPNSINQSLGFTVGSGGFSQANSTGTVDNAVPSGDPIADPSHGAPRLGSETRPANIVLLYCIAE
jgi:microcystin-dependent protein